MYLIFYSLIHFLIIMYLLIFEFSILIVNFHFPYFVFYVLITVDTTKLFGMDLGSALRSLCTEEPSVAITSASTTALSSSTSIYQDHDNNTVVDPGPNSRISDVENHRMDLIERRRIAESLSDASPSCPRTAMALGLSSLSLR